MGGHIALGDHRAQAFQTQLALRDVFDKRYGSRRTPGTGLRLGEPVTQVGRPFGRVDALEIGAAYDLASLVH